MHESYDAQVIIINVEAEYNIDLKKGKNGTFILCKNIYKSARARMVCDIGTSLYGTPSFVLAHHLTLMHVCNLALMHYM